MEYYAAIKKNEGNRMCSQEKAGQVKHNPLVWTQKSIYLYTWLYIEMGNIWLA